ncbi:MAG: carboxypeptidase regulatory-like domain-containing protein [Planctomycetota bacterium]|nr:carboxypeptidase regulatory-like domain-containing protein [Planctomycetota bacterium]
MQLRNSSLILLALGLLVALAWWSTQDNATGELSPDLNLNGNRATADLLGLEQGLDSGVGKSEVRSGVQATGETTTVSPTLEEPLADWTIGGFLRLGKTGVLPDGTVHLRVFPGRGTGGSPLQSTTLKTDDQGLFEWSIPAPGRTVTIEAEPDLQGHRFGGDSRVVVLGDAPPTDLEPYAYALDCFVTGQVLDGDGLGIPGALVQCTMNQAHSDAQGFFRVPITVIQGRARFQVTATGYGPGTFAVGSLKKGENPAPNVVLQKGMTLLGSVRDVQGTPIPGARVASYPEEQTATTSDGEGRFVLVDLDRDARRIPVSASKEGYVPGSITIRRPKPGWSSAEEIQIELAPGASVSGRVVSAQGAPIADAWVSFGVHPRPEGTTGMYTDESGAFTLSPLKPGKHSIWARRKGFALDYAKVEVPSPIADIHDVLLTLDTGFSFEGQVLNESGEPMPGVLLYPQTAGPIEDPSESYSTGGASTDRDGRFSFPNVRCDTLSLQVFSDGYANLKQEIYAGQETLLYPRRAGHLQGQVVDSLTGKPIESFIIKLLPGVPGPGQFEMAPVASGWTAPGMSFTHMEGHWDTGTEALDANTALRVEVSAPGYSTHTTGNVTVPAKASSARIVFPLSKP